MSTKIVYENIKGFSRMSEKAQDFFKMMYQKHMKSIERDQLDWVPVKVVERSNHIEVHFTNGEWLHYWANGTRG